MNAASWSPELAALIRSIEHVMNSAVTVALISEDFSMACKYFTGV
jgi:hypothetical protein